MPPSASSARMTASPVTIGVDARHPELELLGALRLEEEHPLLEDHLEARALVEQVDALEAALVHLGVGARTTAADFFSQCRMHSFRRPSP